MNVNEFTDRHYQTYNGDSDKIAQAYLEAALALPPEDMYQALLPAIRSLASSTCSRLRKAHRGTPPAWAAPSKGKTQASRETAGPPIAETDAKRSTAAPDPWLTYLTRQEQNNTLISVPGAGVIHVLDATRQQLMLAKQAADDLATGFQRTAKEYASMVAKIDATPGATCLRDVLEAIRP